MASNRQPGSSRTEMLAAIDTGDDNTRKYILYGCGCLLSVITMVGLLCAGSTVVTSFLNKPIIALISAILAVVICVPYTFFYIWIDRNEREPFYLLFGAFFWGAILATMVSGIVNTFFNEAANAVVGNPALARQAMVSLSAPVIEEITKGLAVLVIFLGFPREFDNVLDGIVYGALAGLGFATFENFGYYMKMDSVGSVFALFWIRGVLAGIGSHALYTAITGAGLGFFRVMRRGLLRWLIPPAALAFAMFLHFAWNTFAQFFVFGDAATTLLISYPLAVLVLNVPFVIAIFVTVFFNWRFEAKLIEKYLSREDASVVQPGEIDHLVPARKRFLHGIKQLFSDGFGAWWRARNRHADLVKLAFEKWHMDKEAEAGDDETAQKHAQTVLELRTKLQTR